MAWLHKYSFYHSVYIQVTIGGMKFNAIQQRGVKCKELGPNVVVSIAPSSSYEEVLEKGKTEFFVNSLSGKYTYFLADAEGSKMARDINGKAWNLGDYMHMHGLYPSKTRLYCVQVSKNMQ